MAKILKLNEYKCVELCHYEDSIPYITKRYSGHSEENLLDNTQYIYEALKFFHSEFSSIIQTPKPYALDLEKHQVEMEYLPGLPKANLLQLSNLRLADHFFNRCYEIRTDRGFLRSIKGSVVTTPKIALLLEKDFPSSLGFKADLRQNLCLSNESLILADIDSICLEPLGLSELELYGELLASTNFLPTVYSSIRGFPTPVVFKHLNKESAKTLIEATLELLSLRMNNLLSPSKKLKLKLSEQLLFNLHQNFYEKN